LPTALFSAAWTALVSSAVPSHTAPNDFTFTRSGAATVVVVGTVVVVVAGTVVDVVAGAFVVVVAATVVVVTGAFVVVVGGDSAGAVGGKLQAPRRSTSPRRARGGCVARREVTT
jgi:hypothetical protein